MTEGPPRTDDLAKISLYFQLATAMATPMTAITTPRWIATKPARVVKTDTKEEVSALTAR